MTRYSPYTRKNEWIWTKNKQNKQTKTTKTPKTINYETGDSGDYLGD